MSGRATAGPHCPGGGNLPLQLTQGRGTKQPAPIVFYRIHLISPLRRYVPFGSALMARWLGRFACFAVLSLQWIPFLGISSPPIMAAINYAIYRTAFRLAWRMSAFPVRADVRSDGILRPPRSIQP